MCMAITRMPSLISASGAKPVTAPRRGSLNMCLHRTALSSAQPTTKMLHLRQRERATEAMFTYSSYSATILYICSTISSSFKIWYNARLILFSFTGLFLNPSIMMKTGTFIRRMSLDGRITYFNMGEVAEVMKALRIIGSNINQVAKKANETHNVYAADVQNLRKESHMNPRRLEYLLGCIM